MENITEYLFINLYFNNNIVNNYTIPKSTFTMDNGDLINFLDNIFNCMVNELLFVKSPTIDLDWDYVKFYVSDEFNNLTETTKTKIEMNQYPSYGEGIFIIYNEINQ